MKVRKRGYDWNVGNKKSGLTRRSHDCPKSNERSSVVLALTCQRTWVLWLRCDGKPLPVCRPIPIKDVEDSALSSLNTNNSPPRFHTPRTHTQTHRHTQTNSLMQRRLYLVGDLSPREKRANIAGVHPFRSRRRSRY